MLITTHTFLAIYFMLMLAIMSEFGNWFVPIFIDAPDITISQLKKY
jgi:heme/copper-type cytochrome/quinol oxidase subunit 1